MWCWPEMQKCEYVNQWNEADEDKTWCNKQYKCKNHCSFYICFLSRITQILLILFFLTIWCDDNMEKKIFALWLIMHKIMQMQPQLFRFRKPVRPLLLSSGFSPCHLKYEQSQELHSSQTDWRLSFAGSLAVIQEEPCCQMSDPPEQKFQDAVSMVGGLHLLNTEESVKTSARQKTCTSTENEKEVQTEWDEKNKGSGVRNQENSPDTCWDDPFCCGTRPVFHQFSEVLQGRQGAKLLRLWMDIERLKAAKNTERKNRWAFYITGHRCSL